MSLYIPEGTPPLISSSVARVERRLPQAGNVRARTGGQVEPDDVVAEGVILPPPRVINVARALSILPSQVERAMRLETKNKVAEGQVLAQTGRIGGRTCIAPVGGIIARIDTGTGYVTILPDGIEEKLPAAIRGVVMETIPNHGVILETTATQIYGAFGIGNDQHGVLRLLVTDPSEVVTADLIDARSSFAILIGGAGITAAALRRAVQENVRGIVVGGIDERELRTFLGWRDHAHWAVGTGNWRFPNTRRIKAPASSLTILVTEGFGQRPMSLPIFDLLSAQDRQESFIEGTSRLRYPLQRPRVIIPLTRGHSAQIEPSRPQLRAGSTVRLLDSENLGRIGKIRATSSLPRAVQSGIRVAAVEVTVDDKPPFWTPRTSVEALD